MAQNHTKDHSGSDKDHHIIPFKVLATVFATLVGLTILTVVFHDMKLGVLAAPVAFIIATTKALAVIMFFMGLKYEVTLNRIIFASGFVFLAIMFFFCALDIWTRIAQVPTL